MALFKPFKGFHQHVMCRHGQKIPWGTERYFKTSLIKYDRWPRPRENNNKRLAAPKIAQTPFEHIHIENNSTNMGTLFRPFVFTIVFSGGTLVCCAIWQYENMRNKAISVIKKPANWAKEQIWGHRKHGSWRQILNDHWNGLTQGQKVFVPICFANLLVFLAWRIPRFQPAMIKYFCTNPGSNTICMPMLLSTFSHYSFFHFAANMYVLHSFSTVACNSLGAEQFVGLYLSTGVISSFTSLFFKVVTSQPGLSIGASGAIMGILGYVCSQHPDTRLSIILLPMFTFTAGTAIKFILGLDFAGLVFGWKLFDHAAHLGGALGGIAWCYWGNTYIWQKREPLLHWWHGLRTPER